MKKIIGICGLKNSGKDTIGDIICKHDDSFVKMSFADTLKDITAILMGWDRELLQGSTIESREWREKADDYWSDKFGKMITPRIILQELGTNVLRNQFLQSIWVDSLQKKLMEMDKNVVITDVRFPNEIDMIKELGGTIYRVERGDLPKWFRKVENHFNIWNNLSYKQSIGLFSSLDAIPQDIVLEIGNTCSIQETQSDYIWDGNKWLQTYDGLEDINHSEILDVFPELCQIHESEWRWIGYDRPEHIFKNDKTIKDLEKEVLEKMGE